jgi:hypothetical protein
MKVKKIEYIGYENVYNMEVESHHNFAINGGLIVHNCDAIRGFCTMRHMPTIIEKPVHYNWEFEKPKPVYGQEIADDSYIYY